MTSKGDTWSLKISGLQVLDQPDGDCDGSSDCDGAGDYYGDGESDWDGDIDDDNFADLDVF